MQKRHLNIGWKPEASVLFPLALYRRSDLKSFKTQDSSPRWKQVEPKVFPNTIRFKKSVKKGLSSSNIRKVKEQIFKSPLKL